MHTHEDHLHPALVSAPANHRPRGQKSVKIKAHHAKAYRKRHVASLTVFLVVGLFIVGLIIGHNASVNRGLQSAKDFFATTFDAKPQVNTTIHSTYGFSITFNSAKFYATAIDTHTGDLFIANELAANRAYELVRIAPTLSDAQSQNNNMTVRYYHKTAVTDQKNLAALEQTAMKDITSKANLQVKKTGTSNVTYGAKQFLKTDWEFVSNDKVLAGFTPSFTTFTAVHAGKAFVIEVINSPTSTQKTNQYEDVLQSLYFGAAEPSAAAPSAAGSEATAQKSRNQLETLFLGAVASAASSNAAATTSEKISASYSPAVVKIFNVFCQDIYFEGKLAIPDVCSGSTGSGFFINPDGYIASNGHVTNSDPLDYLIQYAYALYVRGSTTVLDRLIVEANIKRTDLPANGTANERAEVLFDLLYKIDKTRLESRNYAVNLIVCLGKDQPDNKELATLTKARQIYPEQTNIKLAKVVGQDYRSIQGFTKFITSDVSIIKIEGSNYPVAKLGSITTLLQGANLNILGYPGNASSNGIVDSTNSEATLTSGKVSSIKNALGSDKKLIETDTLIGHGNSGGPAFNDNGEVMGISTYTAAKVGDSTYNYVRDIKDLVDLAGASSVTISSVSKTQIEWQKALDQFNSARYTKSLKTLAIVKNLYPSHPRVDQFAAAAKQNISEGKDVKDFPIVVAIVGAVLLLLGAGVAVFMIIRHKKVHNVYKAHVGAGMMQPLAQGAGPQTVNYDPAHVAAQKNVVDMHSYMQQGVQTQTLTATPVVETAQTVDNQPDEIAQAPQQMQDDQQDTPTDQQDQQPPAAR